jgi:hypothetical protein
MEVERKHELKVPGPGRYDVKTKPFEGAVTYGYSFGGRPGFSESPGKASKNKKIPPGPGNYSIPGTLESAKGFAFGAKQHPTNSAKSKQIVVPGPGAYSTVRDGGWSKPPYCRHANRVESIASGYQNER